MTTSTRDPSAERTSPGRFATLQPWAVAAPALLIAFLTVAVNLVADAIARSLGTSLDRRRIAR